MTKMYLPMFAVLCAVLLTGAGCLESLQMDADVETDTDTTVDGGRADDGEDSDDGVEVEVDADMSASVKLNEQNDSGESGTVMLTQVGDTTTVVMEVAGTPADSSQPAHIHAGACATIGAVLYPLNPVVDGRSETVVNATLADILAASTELSINVHLSTVEISSYVACGDIEV